MALINEKEPITRKVVQETGWGLTRRLASKEARIVFYTRAVANLFKLLKVK